MPLRGEQDRAAEDEGVVRARMPVLLLEERAAVNDIGKAVKEKKNNV